MQTEREPEERVFRPDSGGCAPAAKKSPRAFTVLNMAPCRPSVAPGAIDDLCHRIPGFGALHVDEARGKVHVIYDGSASAIQQVEHALRTLGYSIRPVADRRVPRCGVQRE